MQISLGGHASVIASLICHQYDHILQKKFAINGDLQIYDEDELYSVEAYQSYDFYIGIGNNNLRKSIFDFLMAKNIIPKNCIAQNVFIAKNAQIGIGIFLAPGSIVMANSQIGNNVIINTLSSVDHDNVIGDHSQITAGVTLGGNVHVGKSCFLGVKSTIIPQVSIGNNTSVMAGSVVTKNFGDNLIIGGYPATIIKKANS